MAAEADNPVAAREAARLFAPLQRAGGLGLAVSGGVDSISLMHLAARWARSRRRAPRLRVLTVDHGLREGSAAEARKVRRWADELGLDCDVLTWTGTDRAIQAEARAARYRLMAERCRVLGLSHIVTAHHLDDQAETVLMRLARGSGIDGLSAMAAQADWPGIAVARPLLGIPKARLVATVKKAGAKWIDDPSNDQPAFERIRMRRLMPLLAEHGISSTDLAISAARLNRAREALDHHAARLAADALTLRPDGVAILDPSRFAGHPVEISLRVLGSLLTAIGGSDYPPGDGPLVDLLARLSDRGFTGATLAGCRLVSWRGSIAVFRELRASLPDQRLDASRPVIWDNRFEATGKPPLRVAALGAEAAREARRRFSIDDLPAAALSSMPAIWRGNRAIALPGRASRSAARLRFTGWERFSVLAGLTPTKP